MLDEAELKDELLSNGNLWKMQRTSVRQDNIPEELIKKIRPNAMSLHIHIVSFHCHLKLSTLFTKRNNKKQHFWYTVITDKIVHH